MAVSSGPSSYTNAVICADVAPRNLNTFAVTGYDLAATLACGQAFNWHPRGEHWTGIVHGRWVRLRQQDDIIHAETVLPQDDWSWLTDYLQTGVDLRDVIASFPAEDPQLRAAVAACHGLRLLRQDPWECLASFILSSTKQIVQIRQIITLLRSRFGEPVVVPDGEALEFSFPSAERLAAVSEAELRACKMGFRAPYLLAAARRVVAGECQLQQLSGRSVDEARAHLVELPGVGEKIADCVLLFAYGFPTAFPIDVWVAKALQRYYFRGRRIPLKRLRRFSAKHFGPNAGYAQQYLFHYIRAHAPKKLSS